jgi:hypothetical protein
MLDIQFRYADDLEEDAPVRVFERRGSLTYDLCRGLYLPEGVAALNVAVKQVLSGEQWFQLWQGEIISMASPPENGGHHGGLH